MEAKIAVKVVAGKFVTVYPMREPKPDEVTFPQRLMSTSSERAARHRVTAYDPNPFNYALTREDQSA